MTIPKFEKPITEGYESVGEDLVVGRIYIADDGREFKCEAIGAKPPKKHWTRTAVFSLTTPKQHYAWPDGNTDYDHTDFHVWYSECSTAWRPEKFSIDTEDLPDLYDDEGDWVNLHDYAKIDDIRISGDKYVKPPVIEEEPILLLPAPAEHAVDEPIFLSFDIEAPSAAPAPKKETVYNWLWEVPDGVAVRFDRDRDVFVRTD